MQTLAYDKAKLRDEWVNWYRNHDCCATSTNGDIWLIHAWVKYHQGSNTAAYIHVRPSRGLSYRIAYGGNHDQYDQIVTVTNSYDHIGGVTVKS